MIMLDPPSPFADEETWRRFEDETRTAARTLVGADRRELLRRLDEELEQHAAMVAARSSPRV